ncbi:MAG: SGNH/GDSL hydrolase family protein [Sphingomonas parapaucimobilis]
MYFDAARQRVTAMQNGGASFPASAPINHPVDPAIRFARVSIAVSDCNPSALTIARGASALPAYKEFGSSDRYTSAMTARAAIRAAAGQGHNIAATGAVRVDQLYNVDLKAYVAKAGYLSVRVPVPADMSVTIANAIAYDPEFGVAWLDIDGTQMSKINAPIDARKTLAVPAGAAYLELPGSKTAPVEVYVGEKVPAIPSSGPLASAGLTASMLFAALRRGTDLVDPARIMRGYFRHTRSGELVQNGAAAVTHSMPCIPGQPVVVSVGQAFTIPEAGIGWQYANGDIAGYVDPEIVAAKTYIAPPDAYFWYYNFPIGSLPACAIGDTVPFDPRTPFVGKTWAMSGDSIVDQDTWGSNAAGILGVASYKNWGKFGTTMSQILDNRLVKDFEALSLYGVSSGTNDFGQQTPIGGREDAKGAATFWGAMRNVIETALDANPLMRIFFMTPLHRGDEFKQINGAWPTYSLRAYRDAIIECCLIYGLPVYDQYSRSGLGPMTFSTYMKTDDGFDGLHPNTSGGLLIARQIAAWIETLGFSPA